MDAFDADVLIYAASPGHPLGARVLRLFRAPGVADGEASAGIGSVLLLPEVLAKPMREDARDELHALTALLGRLELLPVTSEIARVATALGAEHRLRAADAVHLATAVCSGADRFITNNSSDFPSGIAEIAVVGPARL